MGERERGIKKEMKKREIEKEEAREREGTCHICHLWAEKKSSSLTNLQKNIGDIGFFPYRVSTQGKFHTHCTITLAPYYDFGWNCNMYRSL